jgi:hypothetical protein
MSDYKKGDTLWFQNKDSHRQHWIFEAIRGDTVESEDCYEVNWDVNIYVDSYKLFSICIVLDTYLPLTLNDVLKNFSNHINNILIDCSMYGKKVNEASSDVQWVIENKNK